MRTSLVIVGVIFLVVGALLYFLPMQEVKADTTTVADGDVDVRTSSARVTVPAGWALAAAFIGLVLLILGSVIPNPVASTAPKKDSYTKVVESKENVDIGDGSQRRVVRERTEEYNT